MGKANSSQKSDFQDVRDPFKDEYFPSRIESKWQKLWEKKKLYEAIDFDKKQKKYLLVEFPYPTGEGLHIGHAFTNTILDVLARKKRMEGFNILHPMGWDSFGLPAENYAIKAGIHPSVITKKNTRRFQEQNDRLAISYDWSREIDTTDPNYYKWTQWIFIQFFRHGLAYKMEMPVGWCPACKIVLANEEIVGGKCERCGAVAEKRMQKQWLLKITNYADRLADELDLVDYPDYIKVAQCNWIGRKEWVDIVYPIEGTKKTIVVSTTRPDTNFGATFIVIAPEHPVVAALLNSKLKTQNSKLKKIQKYVERAKNKSELERISEAGEKTGVFTGLYAVNQLNGKKMPVWVTDFVLMTVGTGAVVGVPGHDLRDFEFAKHFDLPIVRVVVGSDEDTKEITRREQVQEVEGTMVNSEFLDGMDIHKATKVIMDYMEEKGWGKRTIRYHLRDWIFSRQHYWGEPIPMIFCPSCAKKGITWWDTEESKKFPPKADQPLAEKVKSKKFEVSDEFKRNLAGWFPLDENELPLTLPEVEKYKPTGTGESPLASIKSWVETKCPQCAGPAKRETDTMPNWAGSSWYYLAYCFANKLGSKKSKVKSKKENIFRKYRKLLNYWMPVDVYLGGAEHTTLHLLYSRFWHKFLNDIGVVPSKEPYAARRQHGVILGEDGHRMSKSRGNVINPEDVMENFGVDALRVYLMFMGPYESTMPWDTKGVGGCYRFLKRIWRIYQLEGKIVKKTSYELISDLHCLIKKVGEDVEALKHNTAIAAMMEFLNDWSQKGSLSRKDSGIFLRLLAPFAPYVTEELYQRLLAGDAKFQNQSSKNFRFESIHTQPWPEYDPELVKEQEMVVMVQVDGKVREKLKVKSQKSKIKSEVEQLAKESAKVKKYLSSKEVKNVIFVPGRLINFVTR